MKFIHSKLTALAVLGALILLPGCSDDDKTTAPDGPPEGEVPDFALVDVNPNSTTHDQPVSPRDHLDHISAWYFGSAT